jgi:signal transduction histidine kinase
MVVAKLGVRARAVDLLGRQQVAGIPTAISELFKNAHDAYANRVEVDFYRTQRLFILRDDGIGMGRTDFERRWLTIGTESKADGEGLQPPPVDPDQPVRSIMGEKGIGRLAISLIGTQLLIMTRPKLARPENTTVSFINWSIFGLPGIDLSDIDIPVIELPRAKIPSADDIREMVDIVRKNVHALCPEARADRARILGELDQFKIDPTAIADRLPEGPDLRLGHGTQFWIQPASELLVDDIDGIGRGDRATPLEKVLLGFSNTMTPDHKTPPVETRFRDHIGGGLQEERIADQNFFTPEEFLEADHHIEGDFDSRGQFSGTIRVYGREPVPFIVRWPNSDGRDVACGPIHINFAYVQGAYRESRLPRSEWDAITSKLNRIGGLYIYRDGIRILPYGDSDYDFLDIENRRTRSAGYYFFSYRRMFGVVEITRRDNASLVEKAGREGFQENRAYRQFKSILENFFIQTAAEFFREDGVSADQFVAEKSRVSKEKKLIEKRKSQISAKRQQLQSDLESFFDAVNNRKFEENVALIMTIAAAEFDTAADRGLSIERLSQALRLAREQIETIRDEATVRRPRGVGLTRDLSRLWSRYEIERERLEREVFRPAFGDVERLAGEAVSRGDLRLDARWMVAEVLEGLGERERKKTRSLQSAVHRNLGDLRERAFAVAREGLQAVETAVKTTLVQFENIGEADFSDDNLQRTRERLEREILEPAEEQVELLQRLRDQLKSAATPESLESDDLISAIEGELEERRERDLESLQLAQMGMAVGIVHHEFHAVIRSVRQNVRRLKPWADRNEAIRSLYEDIDRSYAHLDSYLSLFAPLDRRFGRSKSHIRGSDIFGYLRQLFADRLKRHEIELDPTAEFLNAEITEYVSTLYPAFVNLIDNAVHWLSTSNLVSRNASNPTTKTVTLDFRSNSFIISDTGPGILPADHDAIFESGFSRKPGGSGLGLYITRTLLEEAGYELLVDPYVRGQGASFRITIPPEPLEPSDLAEEVE